ncbi:mRNA splicing factor RNA helicase [Hirsutella rhossiliensis]|uniref:mRNA splicing factor RNA helicase n=1 Tax=Hirsutella rhossiliensis TaxID=111463 RepID=A0A9P8MY29_9HYPO|nr:mRNA splicing factor RNA helicase [Hirsutella rhossiliensis]KAH0963385.1 mRNA splicing factor RNA helicase [Hirsutella rhossiliensis]
MDPANPSPHEAEPAVVRFRPSKRRKTYRQRPQDQDDSLAPRAPADGDDEKQGSRGRTSRSGSQDGHPGPLERDADAHSDAEPVVRCNPRRRRTRFRGIGFASDESRPTALAGPHVSRALVPRGQDAADDEKPVVRGIADRFMHQTGLIADPDDRHMTEYIESRLSSRIAASSAPKPTKSRHPHHPPSSPPAATGADHPGQPPAPSTASAVRAGDQPTKHGKLFEVDIPADVRNRRDDAKRRHAEKAPKPRFGRNRRNSDDVKRDEFVEQFLHENRLDVYDFPKQSTAPPPPSSSTSTSAAASGDHRTADDRMAEQFRRQYLDDLAQRRQRRRHAHPPRQQPPPGDVLRGPKLGGSRNSRAAVRNLLLQQEKEKVGRKV